MMESKNRMVVHLIGAVVFGWSAAVLMLRLSFLLFFDHPPEWIVIFAIAAALVVGTCAVAVLAAKP